MSKLKAISRTFSRLSGKTARYNRTLRSIKDWAVTVQDWLTTYGVHEGSDFSTLLKNTGDAKFDLTAIAFKGRPLIGEAAQIKEKAIATLVADIVVEVERLRRYLMNPSMQLESLRKGIPDLRSLFETLQHLLANTEYR
jgi:hypothetical protein